MKISSVTLCGLILLLLFPLNVGSVIINYSPGFPINTAYTWDNSGAEFQQVISSLFPGDDILTQVNGLSDETETWHGSGVHVEILQEIAGYANNTTFGWYNRSDPTDFDKIFEGSDSNGYSEGTTFTERHFGFYIDPNGDQSNRMYTEHLLNNGGQYQGAIFQINGANDYLLAWEDLSLTGSTDQDYQDMIVRMKVNPVPEPATMLLLGSGLVAFAGIGRKKFFKKKK